MNYRLSAPYTVMSTPCNQMSNHNNKWDVTFTHKTLQVYDEAYKKANRINKIEHILLDNWHFQLQFLPLLESRLDLEGAECISSNPRKTLRGIFLAFDFASRALAFPSASPCCKPPCWDLSAFSSAPTVSTQLDYITASFIHTSLSMVTNNTIYSLPPPVFFFGLPTAFSLPWLSSAVSSTFEPWTDFSRVPLVSTLT